MSMKGFGMNDFAGKIRMRDEEGALDVSFVNAVRNVIDNGDAVGLRELAHDLHESDKADLLELLTPRQRERFVEFLGDGLEPEVLVEVEESVRDELVGKMDEEQLADAVRELDSDDAVHLLEDLEEEEREKILRQVPSDVRLNVKKGFEYPEDSAGRLMRRSFVHVASNKTVGETIDMLRESDDLPDHFSEIFVIRPNVHLVGTVPLDRLLRASRDIPVKSLVEEEPYAIRADLDQEELARQFERYDLISAPVIDRDGRLVGVITVDDVVDVIQEEAQEDMLALGGVSGDESLADNVFDIAKNRFVWLFFNLLTALAASLVIRKYDISISNMVALAVLMPIVASLGGNAGTQAMTVTVRALATRNLGAANLWRIIGREGVVGVLNGLVVAIIAALASLWWYGNAKLSLVIAAALVLNIFVAALAGVIIPLALDHFKKDPAVSSGVFVTAVTDIVGFFAFLGLATFFLF
jgi:magnesium transporter